MENLWTKISGICSVAILKGSKFLSHCKLPSFFLKYLFTKIHQQMKLQHVVFQMTGEKPKHRKSKENPFQKYENWPKPHYCVQRESHRHPPLAWLFFVSEACEPKRWASKNSHPLQSESLCYPNPFPSFCPGNKTTLCHFYAQTNPKWNHQRSFICRLKPFFGQLVGGWMLCQEGCNTTHFKSLPVLPLFFFRSPPLDRPCCHAQHARQQCFEVISNRLRRGNAFQHLLWAKVRNIQSEMLQSCYHFITLVWTTRRWTHLRQTNL